MHSNMLMALVEHGRIKTTEHRARDLRSVAEKCVTRATSLGDILLKDPDTLAVEDRARMIHAVRMVRRQLRDPRMVLHLFREVAPRYLGRPGGYTRMVKLGFRRGDGAPMALLEFVEAEMPEREWLNKGDKAEGEKKKKKGLFARLRKKV